ncbi:MAG: cyclase family protein [bacterium]|nr:cyclase family protein [bacterium]
MKYYDISLELSKNTVAWPGDNKFSRLENKGTAMVSKLAMSSHSGTHIDAPRHFLFNKGSVDQIPFKKLVGPAKIAQVNSYPQITLADVKKLRPEKGDRILFKTRNQKLLGKKTFDPNYVSLSLDAAHYLASLPVNLLGIDYFGIEGKSAPGHPVHKILLAAGIVIVEGLDLSKIRPGRYNLAALPLKIKDGDGSPARVVLWR